MTPLLEQPVRTVDRGLLRGGIKGRTYNQEIKELPGVNAADFRRRSNSTISINWDGTPSGDIVSCGLAVRNSIARVGRHFVVAARIRSPAQWHPEGW